jgi:hypothetical protein
MRHKLFVAAVAMSLLPVAAQAQERMGDAALGALSGAVVLGPVGAVAGALVGYTAGPHIAGAWGVRHARRAHHSRAVNTGRPAAVGATQPAQAAPVGVSAVSATPSAEAATSSAVASSSSPSAPAGSVPVQGFE